MSKTLQFKMIYDAALKNLTNIQTYMDFLRTGARVYKYGFADRVMIHYQRPDAIACASYDVWNSNKVNRYIRRGSKGIGIIVEHNGRTYTNYVFDYRDTELRNNGKPGITPNFWKINENNIDNIIDMLIADYGVTKSKDNDITDVIISVAKMLTTDYINNLSDDTILSYATDSMLEGLDAYVLKAKFAELLCNSIAYSIMERCGIDNKLYDDDDFRLISNFNTNKIITLLGTAVAVNTSDVLIRIEKTVKRQERIVNNERKNANNDNREWDNIHIAARNASVFTGTDNRGRKKSTENRQIRTDEAQLPQAGKTAYISDDDNRKYVDGTLDDDRQRSKPYAGNDSGANGISRRIDREVEGIRSDDMGGKDEHLESSGRGSNNQRTDLQLNENGTALESNSSEEEAYAVLIAEIERGTGFQHGKLRIQEYYEKTKNQPNHSTIKELADVLKKEYGIGGHSGEGKIAAVNHNGKGIEVRFRDDKKYNYKWIDVAKIVAEQLINNTYLTANEQEEWRKIRDENLAKDGMEPHEISIGDKFLDTHTGAVVEVVALTGALPYYTDDCTVKRITGNFEITENIAYNKLFDSTQYKYIGKNDALNELKVGDYVKNKESVWKITKIDDYQLTLENTNKSNGGVVIKSMVGHWRDRFRQEGFIVVKEEIAQNVNLKVDDIIYVGNEQYTIVDIANGIAELYTENAPLDSIYMAMDELKEKVAENPLNSAYTHTNQTIKSDIKLHQVGAFFEAYGNDAKVVSALFNITLLSKNVNGEQVDMCGIPDKYYTDYAKQLNDNGYNVLLVNNNVQSEIIDAPDHRREPINYNYRLHNDEYMPKKERYRNNINAINVLKECEFEKRFATPDEQEVLAKYVGWGGIPEVFDEKNKEWAEEFIELYTTLSPEEYKDARASTLTAFYTPKFVIDAIYKALSKMGYNGNGNILEPACGIGNFIGMNNMPNNKFYGVEIDSISARICQQLYQQATITCSGYENANLPDNFFDIAIGNVPFGNYSINDSRYNQYNFLIHDYFFAKTIDKLRTGGIIALITSKGTMDKVNTNVRRYISQKADLIAAIRLPNNTFSGNANTEAVSDIIILKKRDTVMTDTPDWVETVNDANGFPINKYFIHHPEMILGKMTVVNGRYGPEITCVPDDNKSLVDQLDEAISTIDAEISPVYIDDIIDNEQSTEKIPVESIPAEDGIRNYSYAIVNNDIYYRIDSQMIKQNISDKTAERIKGLCQIRDATRDLIDAQLQSYIDDDVISAKQSELNAVYDDFVKKYGYINSKSNQRLFKDDNSYYLLKSLEIFDADGNFKCKADMFTKRTIRPQQNITSADTSAEALGVSIGSKARVDIDYMIELTGKTEKVIVDELKGIIFLSPNYLIDNSQTKYVTADDYLSGNIRKKIKEAEMVQKMYPDIDLQYNIDALKSALPPLIPATDIGVKIGATWIDTKIYEEFIYDLLNVNRNDTIKRYVKISYNPFTSEYIVSNKTMDSGNVLAYNSYGTAHKNAYQIFEDTLNLRDTKVYDPITVDGKRKYIINEKETAAAQIKQDEIKMRFNDWIFADRNRREELVKIYNEKFNSIRPRSYDGSHILCTGMSPEIVLKKHQIDAIARILYGGNTLLAHQVGAGKTFEMIAGAMERKRLGLCSKPLFVVPNHITEQFGAEFLRLYPSANILVADAKSFETKKRKHLCTKIATGDYDAIIIGHTQLEKIPISKEREVRYVEKEIEEIVQAINDAKKNNAHPATIKSLELTRKKLELKYQQLLDVVRDDVVTFEELGIDMLIVDEAHYFKNLFMYTKMRNVAGLQQTEAKKSTDLYIKCKYIDEITNGKGIVFATGTPISNTMTEMYTLMKYLQSDVLNSMELRTFDAWASCFGETQTTMELAPEGNGYRAKTRFASFYNLPELTTIFALCADIKTADMLNLPVPEAKYENVITKPTEIQKKMMDEISERARKVHNKEVNLNEDNMLKITMDGRRLGIDQRLIDSTFPDDPQSKINTCVEKVYTIYEQHSDKKSTQIIFLDQSTPKKNQFNLYDDIKSKLINYGVPAEEIAFIHDAQNDKQKSELFAKMRSGDIRILLGSTDKCGAGMNVQTRLIALHHLDCPWRPSDLEQREGRIIRQGNENKEVYIYRYVTETTFDAYLYQMVENKQKFIGQIMTNKSPVRACDDVDEIVLAYGQIKAICTGNPLIMEKMELEVEIRKLRLAKASYLSNKYSLEDRIATTLPQNIAFCKQNIDVMQKDLNFLKAQKPIIKDNDDGSMDYPMQIFGKTYLRPSEAGKAILLACGFDKRTKHIGEYRGFQMELLYDHSRAKYVIKLHNNSTRTVELGDSDIGAIKRINNTLDNIEKDLQNNLTNLQAWEEELTKAKEEISKPFPREEELKEKEKRLSEIDKALNLDLSDDKQKNMTAENNEAEAEM